MKILTKFSLIIISSISSIIVLNYYLYSYAQNVQKVNAKIAQISPDNLDNLDNLDSKNPLIFIPRGKEDAPGDRKQGGNYSSPNQCSTANLSLTALVYGEKITKDNGKIEDRFLLNHTATEKPDFWFYLKHKKEQNEEVLTVKFQLLNEENELIYHTEKSINSNVGIVAIKLENEAPSLEVNQKYYWSFSIICNQEDNSKNPYVYGTIERVETDKMLSKIANLKAEDKIRFYAKNGLWNDTISTIMNELHPHNSPQAMSLLNQLLDSAQLTINLNYK